jgi:hypothetical protein
MIVVDPYWRKTDAGELKSRSFSGIDQSMSDRCWIAILDDDERRLAAMIDRLSDRFPAFDVQTARSAETFLKLLDSLPEETLLAISLDHDLEPVDDNIDPGTGRDVSKKLAERAAVCPVIIHSTNQLAAIGMEDDLSQVGWDVVRILPYDDLAWIDECWFPAIRKRLVDAGQTSSQPPGVPQSF